MNFQVGNFDMTVSIQLNARNITVFFAVLTAFFVIANLGGIVARLFLDIQSAFGLIHLFNSDEEQSLPTYFSIVMLLFAALVLALIGQLTRTNKLAGAAYWFGLAAVFLFLSIDEAVSIHEVLTKPLRRHVNKDAGVLHLMAWVLPYTVLALGVGAVYLRFLLNIPRRLAFLMILSGAIYVLGAIGAELLTGWLFMNNQEQFGLGYHLAAAAEEAMEMGGIVLFIHAITDYSEKTFGIIHLRVESS